MTYGAALWQALQRSLLGMKNEAARVMRMDVSASDFASEALKLYTIRNQQELAQIATGSDVDIGGLSRCQMALERDAARGFSYGRFYGTVSSQVPRHSGLERSGYAAFRNKSRPTLFSTLSWDTSFYPYLALRVRNRTPMPREAVDRDAAGTPSLRAALHANDPAGPGVSRAVHALGVDYTQRERTADGSQRAPLYPRFFVNIQTDAAVTTDIYQHRLWLDASKGDAWQTVLIPFDDFVLTNTGTVVESQLSMMREKVLTVGVSVLLQPPDPPTQEVTDAEPEPAPARRPDEPVSALRQDAAGSQPSQARGADPAASGSPVRGSKRDQSFPFELDVQGMWAVTSPEQAAALFPEAQPGP